MTEEDKINKEFQKMAKEEFGLTVILTKEKEEEK